MKQQNKEMLTGAKRKMPEVKDEKDTSKSPERKLQGICESSDRNLRNLSPSSESDDMISNKEGDNENLNMKTEAPNIDMITVPTTESNDYSRSSNLDEHNVTGNISVSEIGAQKVITELFLVEMPKDFFQFYDFCKSISKDNPLSACKSIGLKLVGPYDVLSGKIKSSENENNKEKYLVHWRYYYDPLEFQVCINILQ